MNHLLVGMADKTQRLLELSKPGFLLIDDGPIADAFLAEFPNATVFHPRNDRINPLKGMTYRRARDLAALLYSVSPQGENTLTVRNGKRALVKLLLRNPARLDKLPAPKGDDEEEAHGMVGDLLVSPVLKRVLCSNLKDTLPLKGSVVARLNRAELGDFDALVLGNLLLGQFQGQAVVPDFGFYGRDFHIALVRQRRLTAGVNYMGELTSKLQQALVLAAEPIGRCTWEDAESLAKYGGLVPGLKAYTEFVQGIVGAG